MTPNITISGLASPRHRAELERAARHYLALQLPAASLSLLDINISLDIELVIDACCQNLCDNDEMATDFEITINADIPEADQLRALAHECVHVAQYFTGRMKDTGGMFDVYWLDQRVDTRHRREEDLPWEREALHLEWTLLNSFRLLDIPRAA